MIGMNEVSKFTEIRANGDAQAIEELWLLEMEDGVVYVMAKPYMGDYPYAEGRLIKEGDTLTVTFIANEGEDAVAEQKTIVFQIQLLRMLQENSDKLIAVRNESEFFLDFLKNNPEIEGYTLSTLIETVAFELYEANGWGTLRAFDSKFATNYSSMVTCLPADTHAVDRVYDELCRFAANLIAEKSVTLTWALRQYEWDNPKQGSVLEILAGAVKTYSELERDILVLLPAATTLHESGYEFIEISLQAAMTLFTAGDTVYVNWDNLRCVEKDRWVELNVNHLQHGKWYMRVKRDAV